MKANRLLGLGGLAVVVLAAGLLLANQRAGSSLEGGKPLYPSLKTEADNITAVRIFKAGKSEEVALEVLRKESGWTLTQRDGYAADASKVRKLILALTDAKIVEEKTSTPASYTKLGVQDLTAEGASGVRVELAGGKTPVNLIVGKIASAGQTYVRRAGEPASWLISSTIDAPVQVDAWLRRDLLDVAGDRVQAATVTIDGKTYTATKSARAETEFVVDGMPNKGKQPAQVKTNSFSTALQGLSLSEVRTAQQFGSDAPAASATFKTFDGLVVQLNGWLQNDKRYVSMSTSYDAEQAKKFELPAAAPAEPAKTETGKSEQTKPATPDPAKKEPAVEEKVREEATIANQRLSGWVFEIPSYKYEVIFKPFDQLR
jgi:hypothetical protein